ncbi:MAG: lytic transglycosylase domain-containing protein [Rhodobacteraceae bacterium]|nr:lytic transglycosylase domain-containing protein [Paracoccaceae bacterium]
MMKITGIVAIGMVCAGLGPVFAEIPAQGSSIRFVKPPTAGTTRRITVQIDPEEQARVLAALPAAEPYKAPAATPEGGAGAAAAAPSGPVAHAYDWFWETIPTARDAAADRFPNALAALSQGPGGTRVGAPRLQAMQEIADAYGTDILKATVGTDVSPALVLAVIGIESAGKANAVSHAGAQGLMQLIPATAERFGVTDSTDPGQNIRGGVAYLDWLLKEFDRDPLMVLAAYNAGEGAVRANGGVPPYPETRDYVPKVLAAWQVASGLCLTPPELVTDPCVFKVISTGG